MANEITPIGQTQIINVMGSAAGDPLNSIINEYSTLSIPAFWSGVRFIAETLASLPKWVYRRTGNARQPVDHQQNALLSRKANAYTVPFIVFETWHSHAVIHGNGYLFIQRDPKTNRPTGYYNLDPFAVTPFRYQGAQWFYVRGGTGDTDDRNTLILSADQVAMLPGLGYDGMCGYPLIYLMHDSLELARNSQKFANRFLKRGTQVQGSVEVPGSLTKEQIDTIQDRIRRFHSGMDNDYSLLVLPNGAKLNNATIPPEQSQLLQSRQFSVLDMCRILRVPPHIVYDLGRATWGNVEAMSTEVVKYSLRAWIEKAEQVLSACLLTQLEQTSGLYINYSVDSLIRGDTQTQTSTAISLCNGGIITANEARARLDLPPLDDPAASKLRIPVNFPIVSTSETPATTPTPSTSEDDTFAAKRAAVLSSIAPIIADAVQRVETKTTKMFSNIKGKPPQELIVAGNVLAEQQLIYFKQVLSPLNAMLHSQLGRSLDLDRAGQQYATTVRKTIAGQESKPLQQILNEAIQTDIQKEKEGNNENEQQLAA